MRSSDGEGRSIRSDALYPALSGEWEVPVTRNAKITPVNEGVGGGVGGPPLRDHLWQGPPVTRNAEIDPGDNDPPPKMTQGVMTPPNPPSSPSTASSSGVARCWHSNAYFLLFFFAIFLRPTEQICPDSAGPFIVSILLALLFSLFHKRRASV